MSPSCPSCGEPWAGDGYTLQSRGIIAGQRVVSSEQIESIRRCSDCGHEWVHDPAPSE